MKPIIIFLSMLFLLITSSIFASDKIITPYQHHNEFLLFIADPTVTYILILIAVYGLFFELTNPGLIFPGVAGIIALLLVSYDFQQTHINYVGLLLIILGTAFILFEIYVFTFGIIGISGIVAFILGSVMLFETSHHNYHLAWPLIFSMCAVTVAFFFMLLTLILRSTKKAIITGSEGLIGSSGIVLSIMNQQIVVRVLGEIWDAHSHHTLKQGEKIKVKAIEGLTLLVEPLEKRRE